MNVFTPGKTGKLKVKGNDQMIYEGPKGAMNEDKVYKLMDDLERVA